MDDRELEARLNNIQAGVNQIIVLLEEKKLRETKSGVSEGGGKGE